MYNSRFPRRVVEYVDRQDILHYYGDYVRLLFVVGAILAFVATPLWGHLLPSLGTAWEIGGAVLRILLAGLTNPHSNLVMLSNTLISALGVYFFESAAVTYFTWDEFPLFLVREGMAIALLLALYFSVKPLRSMSQGRIGKQYEPGEFETKEE